MARKTKKKVPRGGQELSSCLQGHTTWKADTIQNRRLSDAELELMYVSCMEGLPTWTGATLWKADTNGGPRELSDEALELHQQHLGIALELKDGYSEGCAHCQLGDTYHVLGKLKAVGIGGRAVLVAPSAGQGRSW